MPSGTGGMSTGSDTRLYNPKSESSHMYTANSEDEESYRHGIGDPESMERRRDRLLAEKENAKKVKDLPHLRLETVEPKPDLPPGMEEEDQDQPIMDDDNENAVGAEISQMTGMPGQGGPDASAMFGAQVNQPFGQQTIATGEPMADAWSSLLKEQTIDICNECGQPYDSYRGALSKCGACTQNALAQSYHAEGKPEMAQIFSARPEQSDPNWQDTIEAGEPIIGAWSSLLKEKKPWTQPQMETTPYGRSKADKITEIRGKNVASKLGHPADKGGLNESPLALHRGHRQTTQPISLFPEKYQQSLGRQASRRLMGGIEMPKGMQQRPLHSERPKPVAKPTPPKIPKEPSEPSMKLASVGALKKDIQTVRKKMDYMRFNQLRRLLRRLKNKVDDRRLKMADPGGIGEAGPGNGEMSTNPQGATESIQADMLQHENRSEGAGGSGKMFGRKGSGRVA